MFHVEGGTVADSPTLSLSLESIMRTTATPKFNRSTRQPAFRTMGAMLPAGLSMGPMEFMRHQGLDWTVSKEELFFGMLENEGLQNFRAAIRDDNRKALGVVGHEYQHVQNVELFQFLADIGQFDLELEMVAGGALGKGETVWALARVPSLRIDLGGDVLDTLLCISNGHEGSGSFRADAHTLRKVCSNGMHALTRKGGKLIPSKGWTLKHTAGIQERIAQVGTVLEGLAKEHADTLDAINALAGVPATFQTVESIAAHVWGPVPEPKEVGKKDKARTIALDRMDALKAIWNSPTSEGLATSSTLWTALNAVTEWAEHDSVVRAGNYTQDESRFIGNYLDGSATGLKEKAYSYALNLI